ncbi:hypothetical protein [Pseudomonas syringae group genomosp. 3]|uniref:hypothetical protein n=1 Tax=Pseudomonas syringae group genomosp. 3 TaxID=251701 RepID=UPI0011C373DA|nr:hypothetical protein [Pseudomonas syringae group genomosp. 3]
MTNRTKFQALAGFAFSRVVMGAAHGELPASEVFNHLMSSYEPLPYLGVLMFHLLLRPLIDAPHPMVHE